MAAEARLKAVLVLFHHRAQHRVALFLLRPIFPALRRTGRARVEMHVYAGGGHVFGLRQTKYPATERPLAAVSGDVANHDRDDFAIAVVASALARAWNCSDRARQMA